MRSFRGDLIYRSSSWRLRRLAARRRELFCEVLLFMEQGNLVAAKNGKTCLRVRSGPRNVHPRSGRTWSGLRNDMLSLGKDTCIHAGGRHWSM